MRTNIAIIGHGFVGQAVEGGFAGVGDNRVVAVDPKYAGAETETRLASMDRFGRQDFAFVCAPTPSMDDGSVDSSIVERVFGQLVDHVEKSNLTVVLKSTVTPDVLERLARVVPDFVYNPEFLTEANAARDFIENPMVILGGASQLRLRMVESLYKYRSKCDPKRYFHTSAATASMVKYAINSFLATKVTFMNEFQEVLFKADPKADWSQFVDMLATDGRLGSTHMQVPGPDGRYGAGGKCLPKDSHAITKYDSEGQLSVLRSVIVKNNQIRSRYEEPLESEKLQNIKFR